MNPRKLFFSLTLLLSVPLFAQETEPAQAEEETPAAPVALLAEKLAQLREKAQVLHLVGTLWNERFSSNLPASDTTASSFEWWGSLRDPALYKIEYKPLYSRLTNAAPVFFEESFLVASNGEIQLRLNHSAGQSNAAVRPIRNATISTPPEMRQLQLHLLQSGMAAFFPSLQFESSPISTPVEMFLESEAVTIEPLQEEEGWLVVYEPKESNRREEFRFSGDFDKLYSRVISIFNAARDRMVLQHEFKVAGFCAEAVGGFAIPREIHYTLRVQNALERVFIVKLEKAEVLAGESALRFDVPKGYRLNDRR